ncbi:hypothetical protein PVNG_00523 [Plasmodium vivax North Korean]|uniref:U3 small nucleolar RNA-associated protein 4 n=1 Tax=Plasmodium vivax North Korean TaxID=1035514 RepID=A0A0J9TSA9_PLAVI|nr:hypothetical protein PVNG_00523 [Plasmodium vivax North Korean]
MTTVHRAGEGPQGAQRILRNFYRRTNDKQQLSMNLTEFKFYDYESKELRAVEPSPCRKYICICDSFGVIYIYQIFKNEFLYLQQLHAHLSKSSIISVMWISKKNRKKKKKKKKKKHLFMHNECKDYVLAITTLCGEIVLYDLQTQKRLQSISSNGSISCAKLNNSLQYFGTTNLDGYFYLYNIYSNAGGRIYNCFDRFHEVSGESDVSDASDVRSVSDAYSSDRSDANAAYRSNHSGDDAQARPGKKIKLSSDLTEYLEEEDASSQGEEAESAPTVAPQARHVFSPPSRKTERKSQTGETLNLFITNRFKCKEKLVCLYFVDELKSREVLLSTLQGGKKKKKTKLSGDAVGGEEESGDDRYAEGPPLRNGVRELERSYHSYNHYVLLGSEESKIYKYNITSKLCEGVFKGVNEKAIIWDVLYVYRTDEVVCVDNSGSLTIFDYRTFSVKYFFSHHLYKAVSLAKTLDEDYLFTAGVDRYIIKYARTSVHDGGGAFSNVSIRQEVATRGKRTAQMIGGKLNGHAAPLNEATNVGSHAEEEQFFLHKVKESKELNKNWYRINKRSVHFTDIKRIVLLRENFIVSISDDMSFCLYDTCNQVSRYFQIGNAELNRGVYFSPNLKTIFCAHAWGISIHYNGSLISIGGRSSGDGSSPQNAGVISRKDLEQINAANYKQIAKISFAKNEFVNTCMVSEDATKIACKTNRKLSLYHFSIEDLTICNYDLSKLAASKVYSFAFLESNLLVLSFARCHFGKGRGEEVGEEGEETENLLGEGHFPGGEDNNQEAYELYEHVQDDEVVRGGNSADDYSYTYHVAIYDIDLKEVVEEVQVERTLCQLKKYNGGKIIICTDEQKNVFLFFTSFKKYLQRCFKLCDFNLSRRNIHRSYLFSTVVESLLFIFTLDNFVYVYALCYETASLSFLKTRGVRKFRLSEYRDVSLVDLGLPGAGGPHLGEAAVQDAAQDAAKPLPPPPATFQRKYCLLLRSCDKMRLLGLNISKDLAIDVQLTDVKSAFHCDGDAVEQYYLSSLNFRYNFLNTKQLYFEDASLYHLLLCAMRRERRRGGAADRLGIADRLHASDQLDDADGSPTYDALKGDAAQTGGQHTTEEPTEEPASTDPLQLSLQSLKNIKTKNILNVRVLYTPQGDVVLLLCVPQNIDCTLISVADTKKYVQ